MALADYRRKRKFAGTPEPRGRVAQSHAMLRFVVQEHHARRLHYDFRLELDGVLKSWAVPKGPSMDPAVKRLAVMVEDHPLEYRTFEGEIPKGNYGAGHVSIWDEGTYAAAGASGEDSNRLLREGLSRGRLHIVLKGKKLHGEFALVRMARGGEKNWLLLKKADSSGDELDEPSAMSKAPAKRRRRTAIAVRGAPAAPAPRDVKPMLATLIDKPFDRAGWLFEVKWDGYRAIAEIDGEQVRVYSRTGRSFNQTFAAVVASLRSLGHNAVIDGEVVALDEKGRSQFQLLQRHLKTGQGRLTFVAFDLLHLDGRDLRGLPLRRRKEALARLIGKLPGIMLSEHVETSGTAFFESCAAMGLEGMIAKNGDGTYRPGVRSGDWLKVKTRMRQEAVIGGFTQPRGSREKFGALVLGVYEGKELVYIGHTGGGFDSVSLEAVHERLLPLRQKRCPFRQPPATNAPAQWVRPEVVCEIAFQEWTQDGRMRQPIFVGLREDKPARAVHRERVPHSEEPSVDSPAEPALTNLNKVYWPGEEITKGDLIDYYRDVAPVMVPYLRDRPQSLHRHPNGIDGAHFFQKHIDKNPPPAWVRTELVHGDSGDVRYLVGQDTATVLYMANLGCIEINPWHSRVGSLDFPDYLVIDLDPQDVPFERVIQAALAVRKMLDRTGAASVCKTSGKRGLHVYVPLGARYPNDQVRQFAKLIATLVNEQLPEFTSIVRSPALRRRRVYLDYLQNRRGQTVVAPYSVRPVAGATVSTPLRWSEVRRGLAPNRFTIRSVLKRLARLGDLWTDVLGPGIDMKECLKRLDSMRR